MKIALNCFQDQGHTRAKAHCFNLHTDGKLTITCDIWKAK